MNNCKICGNKSKEDICNDCGIMKALDNYSYRNFKKRVIEMVEDLKRKCQKMDVSGLTVCDIILKEISE